MNRENIKIIFMGTPEFAKESLEFIYNAGYNIIACFTNKDTMSRKRNEI